MWVYRNRTKKWGEIKEVLDKAYPEFAEKTEGAVKSRYYKYRNKDLQFPEDRIKELTAKAKEDYERVKKSGIHRS